MEFELEIQIGITKTNIAELKAEKRGETIDECGVLEFNNADYSYKLCYAAKMLHTPEPAVDQVDQWPLQCL